MYRMVVCAGFALIAVLGTGCGSGDASNSDRAVAPEGSSDSAVLEVTAHDIGFDAKTYEAAAGTLTVRYRNEGSIEHTLVIDDLAGFKLDVARRGATDETVLDLDPGTYTIYCDVPGHRAAGMEATLQVK